MNRDRLSETLSSSVVFYINTASKPKLVLQHIVSCLSWKVLPGWWILVLGTVLLNANMLCLLFNQVSTDTVQLNILETEFLADSDAQTDFILHGKNIVLFKFDVYCITNNLILCICC